MITITSIYLLVVFRFFVLFSVFNLSPGGLVDEHRPLQPRAYQARCYSGQDGLQKESRKADEAVAEGRAGAAA